MVNKTFLPMRRRASRRLTSCNNVAFPSGTGFAEQAANRGLGELCGSSDLPPAREGESRITEKGSTPMENMLLVGLSRQMTLERQMDVVANNVANVNT